MIETYYLGAYWGARQESVDGCARRAKAFLECLARCDSSLEYWFGSDLMQANPREQPVALDENTLNERLLAGRNRTEGRNEVIEDLGFQLYLWNHGGQGEKVRVRVTCGGYSPHVSNVCVLSLPNEGIVGERVLRVPVLRALMTCVAAAWDPDWAVVNSHAYRDSRPQSTQKSNLVGWMVYLPSRHGAVPALPAPARIAPLDGWGTLVITTEERFTAANPTHIGTAERVAETLNQAGLLELLR